MLPSSFEYHRPATLDEALDLLAELGDDAKVLAGGQSLIPMMKLRFASPGHLIDINRIAGLDGIEERDGELRIGALVRHNQLRRSDLIREPLPDDRGRRAADRRPDRPEPGHDRRLARALRPRGDLGAVMLAAGARVVLQEHDGEREVPVTEFLVDTFHVLDRAERAPRPDPRARRRPAAPAAPT